MSELRIVLALSLLLGGCDGGPYTPSAHHHEDASTGSLLPGAGTEPPVGGGMVDPAVNSNTGAGVSRGK